MKCQCLFSLKNINLSSTEFAHIVVKLKDNFQLQKVNDWPAKHHQNSRK